MAEPKIFSPAPGCRIVTDETDFALFGQPPEVLKGLLRDDITRRALMCRLDSREERPEERVFDIDVVAEAHAPLHHHVLPQDAARADLEGPQQLW